MTTNRFFSFALSKAGTLLSNPTRLTRLFIQLGEKLKQVNWSSLTNKGIKEKFLVATRLVRAFAFGHYRNIPRKNILLLLAALIYFVNPVDLIPDFIPATGLVDDFSILLWIFKTVDAELDKFALWEKAIHQ